MKHCNKTQERTELKRTPKSPYYNDRAAFNKGVGRHYDYQTAPTNL